MVSHLRAGKHETNIRSGVGAGSAACPYFHRQTASTQQISETRAAFEFCFAAAGPLCLIRERAGFCPWLPARRKKKGVRGLIMNRVQKEGSKFQFAIF
jgi:hypothetical protein